MGGIVTLYYPHAYADSFSSTPWRIWPDARNNSAGLPPEYMGPWSPGGNNPCNPQESPWSGGKFNFGYSVSTSEKIHSESQTFTITYSGAQISISCEFISWPYIIGAPHKYQHHPSTPSIGYIENMESTNITASSSGIQLFKVGRTLWTQASSGGLDNPSIEGYPEIDYGHSVSYNSDGLDPGILIPDCSADLSICDTFAIGSPAILSDMSTGSVDVYKIKSIYYGPNPTSPIPPTIYPLYYRCHKGETINFNCPTYLNKFGNHDISSAQLGYCVSLNKKAQRIAISAPYMKFNDKYTDGVVYICEWSPCLSGTPPLTDNGHHCICYQNYCSPNDQVYIE